MMICLYFMSICFAIHSLLPTYELEHWSFYILLVANCFWMVAYICYDNTITKFKDEIKDLKKEIDSIKE